MSTILGMWSLTMYELLQTNTYLARIPRDIAREIDALYRADRTVPCIDMWEMHSYFFTCKNAN